MSREMKHSGIEWIGNIPSDWRTDILSVLFYEHKLKNKGMAEQNLLSLSYGNIIRKDITQSGGLLPESFETYNIVDKDDIIFRLTDLQNDKRSLRTGLCKERGIITSAYIAIRKRTNIHAPYFHYLFHTYDLCKVFYGLGDGVRQGMNYADMRKLPLIIPSYAEQKAIADFLDKKCNEIDELVALQEKMIEELKAYKQSVITEAVCKGLNPNVPMKDSGVDWIDVTPEHWEVRAIKTMALLKSGDNLTSLDIDENVTLYPVYGGNGVRGYYSQYNHDGDYALIGRQGALCGNVNYGYGRFWATEHCVVCHPKCNYILKWFGESLRAMNLNQYSLSSAQPGISVDRINNVKMLVPPIQEQQEIADYLNTKCSEIDQLISIKQQKIVELNDYKKSLIYEYTTGKKEIKL